MSNSTAIVLAAGLSSRMGEFKPLLPFDGRPMLWRVIESLRNGGVTSVIVVTGHRREEVESALRGLDVQCVFNPQFANGEMLSSVQTGVRALTSQDHFLLALGDQPAVRPETIKVLLRQAPEHKIVLPTYNERRGHPLCFHHSLAQEILALAEEETLKTVVRRHVGQTLQVPVEDGAILHDVDTPADYELALRTWRGWYNEGEPD
jgi:CTP:molybdopterin cytidylyltransferase MocA